MTAMLIPWSIILVILGFPTNSATTPAETTTTQTIATTSSEPTTTHITPSTSVESTTTQIMATTPAESTTTQTTATMPTESTTTQTTVTMPTESTTTQTTATTPTESTTTQTMTSTSAESSTTQTTATTPNESSTSQTTTTTPDKSMTTQTTATTSTESTAIQKTAITPAEGMRAESSQLSGSVTIRNQTFSPALQVLTSPEYIELQQIIIGLLNLIFSLVFGESVFRGVEDIRFSPGSVKVSYKLLLDPADSTSISDLTSKTVSAFTNISQESSSLVNGLGIDSASIFLKDIDECSQTKPPCRNGGVCQNSVPGYKCFCQQNYQGLNCRTKMEYCVRKPCENGGTCVENKYNFTCSCIAGYKGTFCQNGDWYRWMLAIAILTPVVIAYILYTLAGILRRCFTYEPEQSIPEVHVPPAPKFQPPPPPLSHERKNLQIKFWKRKHQEEIGMFNLNVSTIY